MADENLLKTVHSLSDLELAALLCLVSREHCLISTPRDALDDLVDELQLISTRTFGLKPAVVNCHAHTTLDDFATSILTPASPGAGRASSPLRARNESYFSSPPGVVSPHPTTTTSSSAAAHRPHHHLRAGVGPTTPGAGQQQQQQQQQQIANVVLARDLDQAPRAVQIQALELLRTKRIFTRTSMPQAPKQFLFVAVLASPDAAAAATTTTTTTNEFARVTPHLNDLFYISHWHDPADGFANLEDEDEDEAEAEAENAETASTGSVVKKRRTPGAPNGGNDEAALLTEADIASLAQLGQKVRVDVDVARYQMNIVSFLRMHRAVAAGVTPAATRHFGQLVRCLAPMHRLEFATPSLVALAARKVYLHRIRLVGPASERSVQWGGEPDAVEALLDGVGPEDVIEDVLEMVSAPL